MASDKKEIELTNILTEKQKIFCREYIYDWNATRAARVAGYKDNAIRATASENLTKPNIIAYIDYLKKNLAEVAGISPLMVLREHKKIAFSSIAHLHNTWIELKEFEELTEDQKSCIQEIETKIIRKTEWEYSEEKGKKIQVPYEVEYVKLKLFDKTKSLDSINKMLGYNEPEKVDLSNKDGSLSNISGLSTEELIKRAEASRTIEKNK